MGVGIVGGLGGQRLPKRVRQPASDPFFFFFLFTPPSLSPSPPFPHHNSAGQPYKWLNKDPLAFALGFLGWTVPAASPSPSFGGGSLFGALTESISKELAHFPTGPALDSPFWLQLVAYHLGLFLCMTLAQIGVQARKQGYFD